MPAEASRAAVVGSAESSGDGHAQGAAPGDSTRPPVISARIAVASAVRDGSVGRTVERLAADDPLEPVRSVVGDDPAVVDHGDLVGQRVGLVQVLGGQQHGRAVSDQPSDDVPHVLALGRVQAGGRLVEEDH